MDNNVKNVITNKRRDYLRNKRDLPSFLAGIKDYEVKTHIGLEESKKSKYYKVFYKEKEIGYIYKKNAFYEYFLKGLSINWRDILSAKLLPEDAFFFKEKKIVYIIEYKFQQVSGSVDEKLQTCGYKKIQYEKLLSIANLEVQFIYVFNEWFKKPRYKDVLEYIEASGCFYYFNTIPLEKLGLPS